MTKKIDALLKNWGTEKVAVIQDNGPDGVTTVALLNMSKALPTLKKLEGAFMLTNTIEDAWWNNKTVTKMFDGKSCRSTSVGEMILVGNEKFKCESSGWSKV